MQTTGKKIIETIPCTQNKGNYKRTPEVAAMEAKETEGQLVPEG